MMDNAPQVAAFIQRMRAAAEQTAEEREILFMRSSDRFKTVKWLLDVMEKEMFGTETTYEEIHNFIVYGQGDDDG